MAKEKMHNFHVPLPESLYTKLREEAVHSRRSSTELARLAIYLWLKENEKKMLHASIADYASRNAGTEFDLDEELSAASLEYLAGKEAL